MTYTKTMSTNTILLLALLIPLAFGLVGALNVDYGQRGGL